MYTGVVKENIPRSRAASNKIDVSKPIARKLASTCAYGVGSSSGSGVVTQAKVGKTVASKPCTLVIQPSTKKPTQARHVMLFWLMQLHENRITHRDGKILRFFSFYFTTVCG